MKARGALTLLVFVSALSAQGTTFYVNGLTGSDVPASGGAPGTPWKTVAYAMRNVPSITTPGQSGVIVIEGNQTYSAATNGETFPIVPAPNYIVRGSIAGHGVRPTFQDPSVAGTLFALDPRQDYLGPRTVYRGLQFDGGNTAFEMGALPGFRHAPEIRQCSFRNQSYAAIHWHNDSGALEDPLFEQNRFEEGLRSTFHYVRIDPSSAGSTTLARIRGNTFVGSGTGIYLSGGATPHSVVLDCSFNTFEQIRFAISSSYSGDTDLSVRHCHLHDVIVGVEILRILGDLTVTLEDSVFDACGTVLSLRGAPVAGQHSVSARRCAIVGGDYGLEVDAPRASSAVTLAVSSEDNLYRGRGQPWQGFGFGIRAFSGATTSVSSLRDSFIGLDRALWVEQDVNLVMPPCAVRVDSMIAAGSRIGLDLDLARGTASVRHATIADCGTGFRLGWYQPAITAQALIFDGNATDVVNLSSRAFSPTYSCASVSSFAGVGNLNLTDPQLIRPVYKLGPASPCIDAGDPATLVSLDYEGDPRASVGTSGGSAIPDIGADEYVYAGSIHRYGVPGIDTLQASPRISSAQTTAAIGGPLVIDLTDATSAQAAALVVGTREDSGPLPFHLGPLGFPNAYLWNEYGGALALVPVSAMGAASHTENLPMLSALVGETFTLQWLCLTRSGNGVSSTEGLRVTLGQ